MRLLHQVRPFEMGSNQRVRVALPHSQSGVALAISLILLVAMTILGVATLSGTRLNEKITSNAQQKAVAFEVAESALETVSNDASGLMDSIRPAEGTTVQDNPEATTDPVRNAEISTKFDQLVGSVGTDIEGEVTIQYCGEGLPVGSSLSVDESGTPPLVGYLIDVNGLATIKNSSTRADHLKRVSVTRPGIGLSGSCTTR